jgi:hypothetical protein
MECDIYLISKGESKRAAPMAARQAIPVTKGVTKLNRCLECKQEMPYQGRGRPRRFCNPTERRRFHERRTEQQARAYRELLKQAGELGKAG